MKVIVTVRYITGTTLDLEVPSDAVESLLRLENAKRDYPFVYVGRTLINLNNVLQLTIKE